MNIALYVILLLVLFPIILFTPQVFADTSFVSAVPGSSVPGCEENLSCYSPFQTKISIGDSVVWTNDDNAAHTVTSGTASVGASGIFDSSLFMAGESFGVEFFESGVYDYFCMVHPWMTGTILVDSSPTSSQGTSGITPRGTPIPLDSRPKSVSGFTNYQNDEWNFSMDVPIEWKIQESAASDEGWKQVVLFTPDPDFLSTYLSIDYFFNDDSFKGLYGNNALSQLEDNVKSWCDAQTLDESGFTCNDFELIQSEILDEQYIVSYTFTEIGNNGIDFYKTGVLSVLPLNDSEYLSIDIEIDFDNIELHSQQIGYMLTSTDFSIFETMSSPATTVQSGKDIPSSLNFKKYTNNDFDFSINYPSEWLVDDELLVDGDFYNIVSFSADDTFTQTIDTSIIFNDFKFSGLSSSQYLSKLGDYEAEICKDKTYDYDGYSCSNFVISDELSGSFTDDSGNKWHALYYTYTEDYPDQSYDVAIAQFNLHDDDTVIVYFYFDLDTYENYLSGVDPIQLTTDVMYSFEFTSSAPSTTPVPDSTPITQLECGTGTHEENGKCVSDSNGGGCLIATATYGSELAPQVQQLRELRDNSLLTTESGTSFMNIFNDVYYSFSPIIANYERENPAFKEAVKLTLTPMITTLSLMEYADSEESVLSIGISLIILNVGMYIGIPVVVIVGIRKQI
jgi:plastocyanin